MLIDCEFCLVLKDVGVMGEMFCIGEFYCVVDMEFYVFGCFEFGDYCFGFSVVIGLFGVF